MDYIWLSEQKEVSLTKSKQKFMKTVTVDLYLWSLILYHQICNLITWITAYFKVGKMKILILQMKILTIYSKECYILNMGFWADLEITINLKVIFSIRSILMVMQWLFFFKAFFSILYYNVTRCHSRVALKDIPWCVLRKLRTMKVDIWTTKRWIVAYISSIP